MPRRRTTPAPKPAYRRTFVQNTLGCLHWRNSESLEARRGQVLHEFAHRYHKLLKATRQSTSLGDVEQLATDAFKMVGRGLPWEQLDELLQMADRYARTHIIDPERILEVETSLVVDMGWAIFTGDPDLMLRIDDDDPLDPPSQILIPDLKSQWAPDEFRFQGRFYAGLLYRKSPAVEEVTWSPDFFMTNQEPERYVYEREETVAWFEETIAAFKERIEGPKGQPTGGPACQYCAERLRCAAALLPWSEVPEDDAQYRELVGDLIRHDARHETLREVLKEYSKTRLPIRIGVDGAEIEVGWLEPHEPQWKASDPLGIVTWLEGKGYDGKVALFTAIDPKAVPEVWKPDLAAAGVARYEKGPAQFKVRKIDTRKKRGAA